MLTIFCMHAALMDILSIIVMKVWRERYRNTLTRLCSGLRAVWNSCHCEKVFFNLKGWMKECEIWLIIYPALLIFYPDTHFPVVDLVSRRFTSDFFERCISFHFMRWEVGIGDLEIDDARDWQGGQSVPVRLTRWPPCQCRKTWQLLKVCMIRLLINHSIASVIEHAHIFFWAPGQHSLVISGNNRSKTFTRLC